MAAQPAPGSSPAPLPGSAGSPAPSDAAALAWRDELFRDADRHGPRARALVARVVPAGVLLVVTVAVLASDAARLQVADSIGRAPADLALPGLGLLGIAVLAAAMAPLARVDAWRLAVPGVVLLLAGAALVGSGVLVASLLLTVPGALLVGVSVARAVRRAAWVLPLLLVAGASDASSVAAGPTSRLLDGATAEAAGAADVAARVPASSVAGLDAVVVHLPGASQMVVVGIVDVIAIGLLVGLSHVWWQPVRRGALACGAALLVAIAAPGTVPALPLLGLAWVAVNGRFVARSIAFSARRVLYLGG